MPESKKSSLNIFEGKSDPLFLDLVEKGVIEIIDSGFRSKWFAKNTWFPFYDHREEISRRGAVYQRACAEHIIREMQKLFRN